MGGETTTAQIKKSRWEAIIQQGEKRHFPSLNDPLPLLNWLGGAGGGALEAKRFCF